MLTKRWLLSLALALLAPAALASVPRTAGTSDAAPLRSLTLSLAAPAAAEGGLALFGGDEIARAIAQRDQETGVSRFALGAENLGVEDLDVEQSHAARARVLELNLHRDLELLAVEPLRGPPDEGSKTRIGVFELAAPFRIEVSERLSLGVHWGCGRSGCELAEDHPQDPLGLVTKSYDNIDYSEAPGPLLAETAGERVSRCSANPGTCGGQKLTAEFGTARPPLNPAEHRMLQNRQAEAELNARVQRAMVAVASLVMLKSGIGKIAEPVAVAEESWAAAESVGPRLGSLRSPSTLQLVAAAPADAEAEDSAWILGPGPRGYNVENRLDLKNGGVLGGRLPPNFRTLDFFNNGVATSVKTLETTAPSYVRNPDAIFREIRKYSDKLTSFNGGTSKKYGVLVSGADITSRQLFLGIPDTPLAPPQRLALEQGAAYARGNGIDVTIFTVP